MIALKEFRAEDPLERLRSKKKKRSKEMGSKEIKGVKFFRDF